MCDLCYSRQDYDRNHGHDHGVTAHQTGDEDYAGAGSAKPYFDWDQAAAQITNWDAKWGGGDFGSSGSASFSFGTGNQPGDFSLTTLARNYVLDAVRMISDVANITFTHYGGGNPMNTTSNLGEIVFVQYGTGSYGGGVGGWGGTTRFGDAATTITSGFADFGGESLSLMLHEIGHAIGLNHPGAYDGGGTYASAAEYWNDTEQYTVMSYWDEGFTGGDLTFDVDGLMLHDIAALQRLYGVNTTTRTGDSVYGFGSNVVETGTSIIDQAWALTSASDTMVAALWDAGGVDELNLSGYNSESWVDLREEAFSSFGGLTNNFAIARGTIIENATGGTGKDVIVGNDVANVLNGNTGDDELAGASGNDTLFGGNGNDVMAGGRGADTLDGGAGNDIAVYLDSDAGVTIDLTAGTGSGGAAEGDILGNIETIIGSSFDDVFQGSTLANTIIGGGGNDTFLADAGGDIYIGGTGNDTVSYATSNAAITVNLLNGIGVGSTAAGDIYVDVESVIGSLSGDLLRGDDAANTLAGQSGGDILLGQGGNDLLNGGAGGDIMTGGAGADTFAFELAFDQFVDVVTDFNSASGDKIRLVNSGGSNYVLNDVDYTTLRTTDVLVTLNGWDNGIVLRGAAGSLDISDFEIV
ncbi:MAG: M10 family metallopeptidase C-terminal domain-containing protein [Rhizobiaceae bacterium]